MKLSIRYFASIREAIGLSQESVETSATTLGGVRDELIARGGAYAQAAARALVRETTLSPAEIVRKALTIAGEICIYTNTNITVLEPSA